MAVMKKKVSTIELDFNQSKNNANIHIANGDNDVTYKLTNVTGKGWKVTADGEVIVEGLKGYARAVDAANAHANETETDTEEEETPVKAKTVAKTPVSKAPVKAPVKTTAKKVKEFADYDTWLEEQPVRVKVGAGKETIEQYTNRTNKLAYGRAKGKYNRENGISKAEGNTSAKVARVAKPKPEPVSREEMYGDMWNDFREHLGEPDVLAYELSRVNNALASVEYSIQHGIVHPHAPIAQNSYYKAVERAYTSEARLLSVTEEKGLKLPKDWEPRYYGLTLSEVDETEQTALKGYIEYYSENPEQANPEAQIDAKGNGKVKGKPFVCKGIDETLLTLYPVVSVKKTSKRK